MKSDECANVHDLWHKTLVLVHFADWFKSLEGFHAWIEVIAHICQVVSFSSMKWVISVKYRQIYRF